MPVKPHLASWMMKVKAPFDTRCIFVDTRFWNYPQQKSQKILFEIRLTLSPKS